MIKILSAIFMAFLLNGCVLFKWDPYKDPIVQETFKKGSGEIHLGAISAAHRAVIGKFDPGSQFCAEPPPDMANAVASAITAALNLKVEGKGELNAEVAKSLVVSVEKLYSRSHSVQYLRDASYSLCQAYINGALKQATSTYNTGSEAALSNIAFDSDDGITVKSVGSVSKLFPQIPANLRQTTLFADLQQTLLDNTMKLLLAEFKVIYNQEIAKQQAITDTSEKVMKSIANMTPEQLRAFASAGNISAEASIKKDEVAGEEAPAPTVPASTN
jgi:hypothetical protein